MINFMLNILMYKYKGAILRYEDLNHELSVMPNYYIYYNNTKFIPYLDASANDILLTNIPDLYFKYRKTRGIRFLPLFYLQREYPTIFTDGILIDPMSIIAHQNNILIRSHGYLIPTKMRFSNDIKRITFDKPVYFSDTRDYTIILSPMMNLLAEYFQPIKARNMYNVHGNIFACYVDGIARASNCILIRVNIQNYDYDLITFDDNEYKSVLQLLAFLTNRELIYDNQFVKLHIDNDLVRLLSRYYKAFIDCINLDKDIFINTSNTDEIGGIINECVSI